MSRQRRIKPQKSFQPPSARGSRVLVQESLPEGSTNSIHHSEDAAPAPEPVQVAAPKAVKAPAPVEKKAAPAPAPVKAVRAHEADGKFHADDPATPDKNEAWKDANAPASPTWDPEMTKRELLKFLPKDSELTSKSSKEAILKELGKNSG